MTSIHPHAPARVGDIVDIGGRRLGEKGRFGEILAVLGDPAAPRFHVRWEDGHESIFYPGSDVTVRPHQASELAPATRTRFDLVRELARAQVGYELIPHRRTQTAADEANAVHVDPGEVAKTVVVAAGRERVRAVIAASDRLDLRKLRVLIGSEERLRLVSEAELAAVYPMFELGAVPPFGGPVSDRVVIDTRLATRETVVLDAGTHAESIRMRSVDLLAVAGAEIGEITAD
jgi:Ala-tRNA(Pro) deacylase